MWHISEKTNALCNFVKRQTMMLETKLLNDSLIEENMIEGFKLYYFLTSEINLIKFYFFYYYFLNVIKF